MSIEERGILSRKRPRKNRRAYTAQLMHNGKPVNQMAIVVISNGVYLRHRFISSIGIAKH